jgi:epoxyqueuosine reductase QueG
VRIGSVVTDMPLDVSRRTHEDYRAPCLASGGKVCGECIAHCPAGAITTRGMDKSACYVMRGAVRKRFMDGYVREMGMLDAPVSKAGRTRYGYSLGCALCMCGVPCEERDPFAKEPDL